MRDPVDRAAGAGTGLVQLSPGLYWYRDTCNVYLVVRGERGLLVDFGSGGILEHLDEAGVREVDGVLHTHHHRDQCQGDHLLADRGIPIAVPEREAHLFAETDAFWRLKRIYDNYDVSSVGFTFARSVPVARTLRDYETVAWHGLDVRVLPTPGHTKGSVTFVAEIDGIRTAFPGDLIAGPGHVPTIHDLQWQYGLPDAVGAALHSVTLLASLPLQRLCPSHGRPMDDAPGALRSLERPLRELYGLQAEMRRNRVWPVWPHSVDQPKAHVLPHLWANPHSVANCYALLADDGRALLLDYGFPSWDHMAADMRFVEHSLDELRAVAGLRSVEAVIPSHYHDDHLAGLPWLQATQGTQAWIFENFAEMVANPAGYNVPCLLPHPIRVDRTLPDRGSVAWDRWRFDVFHMPGHTWWALGLFAEIDGTRVAFTGDNLLAGTLSPLRAAAPVYRNRMLVDSIAVGVRRLMEFEPELLLTGHTGALRVERKTLEDFHAWARQLEGVFRTLVSVPAEVNFALDPSFATLYPYRSPVAPGATVDLELRVTNHGAREAEARGSLVVPPSWDAGPAAASLTIKAGETGVLRFSVPVPAGAAGRHVLCADLTLGDRRFGQVTEALVGDLLEVEYQEIVAQPYGWTRFRPGAGFLRDLFPYDYVVHWEIRDGWATSPQIPRVRLPDGAFMGTAGVAPSRAQLEAWTRREEEFRKRGGFIFPPDPQDAVPGGRVAEEGLRTLPPRENFGNVDAKQLTRGSRLYVPVAVPGALYSAGDGHFAQGDGEACITAIEMGATVAVRFRVHAGEAARRGIRWPRFAHPGYFLPPEWAAPRNFIATVGMPLRDDGTQEGEDHLSLAARNALIRMIELLTERGYTRDQGYVICSVAVDLRISNVVDLPNVTVSALLPEAIFRD